MSSELKIKRSHSYASDEEQAVAELASTLGNAPGDIVIFFCSPKYDLARLAAVLSRTFKGTVIGCTSSGQIGLGGYKRGGITAASLQSTGMRAKNYLIEDLALRTDAVLAMTDEAHQSGLSLALDRKRFGFLLVDGLSMAEERLIYEVYKHIGNVPIVGGSAGDDLAFERSWVYHDGRFFAGAATFSVFETDLPFRTFKFQHFVPTDKKLIITAAVPEKRLVMEINGLPAGEAYAEAIGSRIDELDSKKFSKNPLLLRLGEDNYVRSIRRMNADLSFSFFCAIEEGMVLTLGKGIDVLQTAKNAFNDIRDSLLGDPFVIGFDCILRRIEMEQDGLDHAMGELLSSNNVIGFSTYGEQFNSLHVNQTFTGIAIGGAS